MRNTPQMIFGRGVWMVDSDDCTDYYISSDYFYDITDNSLKSVYDEDGNMQYQCYGSVNRFRKDPKEYYTVDDLEEIREYFYRLNESYWNESFPDYEFQPLFPEDEGTVSFAGIEETAYDDVSIEAMYSVRNDIQQAEATIGDNQVEQGE
jgi:hypothetical protein